MNEIQENALYEAKGKDCYFYVTRIEKRGTRKAVHYVEASAEGIAADQNFNGYIASESDFKKMIRARK